MSEERSEPAGPPRVRAFLAVNFPVAAVRRMAEEARAIATLVAASNLDAAWVPAANIHLTLKFFGAIPTESVAAIVGRLARELAGRPGFDLEARGLGAFPDGRSPRVLWAGVRPSASLAALQQDVERWMEEFGFPREARAFHPHLTLARLRPSPRGAATSIEALLAERSSNLYGVGRVGEVVLYESRTLRTGAEYVALSRVPLQLPQRDEMEKRGR